MKVRVLFSTLLVVMLLSSMLAPFAAAQGPTDTSPPSLDDLEGMYQKGLITLQEYKEAAAGLAPASPGTVLVGGEPEAVFFAEDFETWPPPGWTIVNNGGDCVWDSNTFWGRTNYAGGDGQCADADSDGCGSGTTMDTELQSPVIDLSGAPPGTVLQFVGAYNDLSAGGGDYAEVLVSPDGGMTWNQELYWDEDHDAYGPGEVVVIDMTPYVGSTNVVISFHYGGAAYDWWFEVDQVRVQSPSPDFINSFKEVWPTKVVPGDVLTYTVHIINTGNAPALNAVMADAIPAGTAYVPDSLTCDSGTCWYDDVDNAVYWNGEVGTPASAPVAPAAAQGLPAASPAGDHALSVDSAFVAPGGPNQAQPFSQIAQNLLNDAGFENGPPPGSGWTEWTDTGCEWILDPTPVWGIPAHTGVYAFWAAGYCGVANSDYVEQSVTIPPGCNADLSFWATYYRPDADDPPDDDYVYVEVDGNRIWDKALIQANDTYPNWVEETGIDLSAYNGQVVNLRIGGESLGANTGNALIDDVLLECTAVSPVVNITFAVEALGGSCGVPLVNEAVITDPEAAPVVVQAFAEIWDVVYVHEGFEGAFPPAGWVVVDNVGSGVPGSVWDNANPGGRANLTGGTGLFAIADSDEAGSGVDVDTELWLPPVDIPACQDTFLVFKSDYYNLGDTADVDISLDGGTTWENLLRWTSSVRGPHTEWVPLGGYGGATGAILRFHYYNANYAWWWQIDDVQIVGCVKEGLFLTPDYQAASGCPGEVMAYPMSLENCTGMTETFSLYPMDNDWFTWVEPGMVEVPDTGIVDVMAYVQSPCDADGTDLATIVAADGGYSDTAEIETTADPGTVGLWEVMAAMPEGRVFEAVVGTDDYVYVIGGTSDAGGTIPTDTNFRYDIANDLWDTMTAMPVTLESINAGLVGDQIYVPGGDGDANTYVYDIPTDSWSVIPPSGTFEWGIQYATAVDGDILYRLGGLLDDGAGGYVSTNRVWALDTVAGTWTELPPMQADRTSFSAAAIGGNLYVAGGVAYPGFTPEMTSEMYDGAVWSYVAPVPDGGGAYTRWSYNADATAQDKLWLMAGRRDADWLVLDHTGFYDPATDSWTTTPDLPILNQGRVYLQGAAAGGYLFAIGGRDAAGAIIYDVNERLFLGGCPEVEANIEVTAPPLEAELCEGETATLDFEICNTGDCPLEFWIQEMTATVKILGEPLVGAGEGRAVELALDPTAVAVVSNPWEPAGPTGPGDPVDLVLDDGGAESFIGVNDGVDGTQWIWLNRFTPAPSDFPFYLNEIAVVFGSTNVNVGDAVDIMVYEDTDGDGDPSNATLLAVLNETVQANDGATWSVYAPPTPPMLYGPGDVLIGVINRYQPGTGGGLLDYPAAIDRTASAYRSWLGWWSVEPAPDPPILPPDVAWGIIDDFGLAGNWMVRGAGETFDISWVSAMPDAGVLPTGWCMTVEVTLDATDLLPGDYLADLIIHSNDPDTPTTTLNTSMTVLEPVALVDVTYVITDLQVTFDATVSGDEPITFAWDFGDGNTSDLEDPVHTYDEGGCYTVTLEASNECGVDVWSAEICVCDPAAIVDVTYVIADLEVTFDATVSGDEPISFAWDFGDDNTSDIEDPIHTYAAGGCYTVTLEVSNECGTDVWSDEVCVEEPVYYYYLPMLYKNH
jgi:uncharacterized repeat protein (TIGR01451 family)